MATRTRYLLVKRAFFVTLAATGWFWLMAVIVTENVLDWTDARVEAVADWGFAAVVVSCATASVLALLLSRRSGSAAGAGRRWLARMPTGAETATRFFAMFVAGFALTCLGDYIRHPGEFESHRASITCSLVSSSCPGADTGESRI